MRRRHRILVAAGLLAPACSPAPAPTAQRGRPETSANPPAEAGPDVTATTVATNAGPAPSSSVDAATGPTTTAYVITVPTNPPTTITVRPRPLPTTILPENGGPLALASYYGAESGARTADGTAFDGTQLVFAHKTMAFGTLVRFCGPLGCVVARCADRGPFVAGRTFDLSEAAFARVAPLSAGVVELSWEVVR